MIVEVLTGPQGGGKSQTMRDETIANKGLYLFALPTTELIDEQSADFFKAAPWLTNRESLLQVQHRQDHATADGGAARHRDPQADPTR